MPKPYIAYLLRLWQTEEGGKAIWRASLEDPHTRQVTGFASLQALEEYIEAVTWQKVQAADEGEKKNTR